MRYPHDYRDAPLVGRNTSRFTMSAHDRTSLPIGSYPVIGSDVHEDIESDLNPFDLDAQWPVLLLPIRLETRFDSVRSSTDQVTHLLKVRFYPDAIFVSTHLPTLTAQENQWRMDFQAALPNSADSQKLWADMVRQLL